MVEGAERPPLPSLITYNCASAHFYQQMGSTYLTPLIGHLFRSWRDYLDLLSDLPGHLQADPVFADPVRPRYPASNRPDYPVLFLRDVESHWMHARDEPLVRHRLSVGLARMRWDDVLVTFSESNFGPEPLTNDEWSDFVRRWEAIPYRKLFFSTGRYGEVGGSVRPPRWRGLDHFVDVCGRDGFLCKSSCPGCGRPRWGQYSAEAIQITRALGLEPFARSAGPFPAPDKGGLEAVLARGL